MQDGDKIVCINDSLRALPYIYLTLYKTYTINQMTNDMYHVNNDNDFIAGYAKDRFISLIEYRKRTILKLKERICLK